MTNLLYKYLDANGAKKMLELSNLMYTNATMFNDPFDCHPGLKVDLIIREAHRFPFFIPTIFTIFSSQSHFFPLLTAI